MGDSERQVVSRRLLLGGFSTGVSMFLVGCIGDDEESEDDNTTTQEQSDTDLNRTDNVDDHTQEGDKDEDARIRPWSDNPFYWEYDGLPTVLFGATDTDTLFQWGMEDGPTPEQVSSRSDNSVIERLGGKMPRMEDQLLRLAEVGGNYIRTTMNNRGVDDTLPYEQLAEGQYDLSRWNDEYWVAFEQMLDLAATHEIIVQIELWDGHNYQSRSDNPDGFSQWEREPLNPKNNVNYTEAQTTLPEIYTTGYLNETHPVMLTHPAENDDTIVRPYQERFIEKVLSISLGYGNVLYTIANENWAPMSFSRFWRDFVRGVAEEADDSLYLADMRRYSPSVDPVTDDGFDYADISQSAQDTGQSHYDAIEGAFEQLESSEMHVPVNSTKQYGSDDIVWTGGDHEGIARLWRSIFAGQAAVRNHRPPYGLGQEQLALQHLTTLRRVTSWIDPPNARPHRELLDRFHGREENEAYAIGQSGYRFAVYFPHHGDVDFSVTEFGDAVHLRWVDSERVRWVDDWKELAPENNRISLESPLGEHMVAIIADEPFLEGQQSIR